MFSRPRPPEPALRGSPPAEQLEQWRNAAKRVARAWMAWLAVDRPDRRRAYTVYLEALADEEHAAAQLERDMFALGRLGPGG
jgi:hypothetical protein